MGLSTVGFGGFGLYCLLGALICCVELLVACVMLNLGVCCVMIEVLVLCVWLLVCYGFDCWWLFGEFGSFG